MAAKRQHMIDYAEDSYTDEDDEMDFDGHQEQLQENRPRVGRPRKTSVTTNSSMETLTNHGNADNMSNDGGAPTVRRRGRGPSKRPCLNRNALMARENRQRKKEYIERIENRLQNCQKENMELTTTIKQQAIEIKRLTSEVSYLKTVLNNKSRITSLLQAMNESLQKMHGDETNAATASFPGAATAANNILPVVKPNGSGMACKPSVDVLNWITSGQNTSKTNNVSMPLSGSMNNCPEVYRDDSRRPGYGQMNNTVKVARKTMPLNSCQSTKVENPPSIESVQDDDEKRLLQKSSPNSGSFCEYQTGRSSAGLDNQVPTTPISALSNSLKNEASLSDTEFSQLSSFNVDLFDNFESEVANPLQFEQDAPELFNDDTLFHSIDKDAGMLSNDIIDPLEISKMSDALNEKTLFNSLENTGVCLHINSSRVSLEYCSICHMNSLNNEYH